MVNVPFVLFLLIAQFWLLANLQLFVPGDSFDRFQTAMIVYLVMTTAFLAMSRQWQISTISSNPSEGFVKFFGGFLVAWMVLTLGKGELALSGGIGPNLIFFLLVVAVSEELIFRGLMPEVLASIYKGNGYATSPLESKAAAWIFSSAIFAFFHAAVYNGNASSIIFAFLAGLAFSTITSKAGLESSMGVHAAWNLVIGGVL